MPAIVEGFSQHLEGENIRTLARVVSLSQVMLTAFDAGPLTVRVFLRGKQVYTKTLDYTANGITDPQHPDEWTLRGQINFDYTWDAALLALESPSFEFKGGRGYLIQYDFDTESDGHVLLTHKVEIVGVPG